MQRQQARAGSPAVGVTGPVKGAAAKVKGPALAAGVAAAGVAGGLALRARRRRRTVLGIPLPRSMSRGVDLDTRSVAKTVGSASKRFGKSTKSVSRDLERVGDQAERIGRFLD